MVKRRIAATGVWPLYAMLIVARSPMQVSRFRNQEIGWAAGDVAVESESATRRSRAIELRIFHCRNGAPGSRSALCSFECSRASCEIECPPAVEIYHVKPALVGLCKVGQYSVAAGHWSDRQTSTGLVCDRRSIETAGNPARLDCRPVVHSDRRRGGDSLGCP